MLPMWWQPVSFVLSVGGCKATVNFERFLPGPVTPYRSSAGARREPDTQRIGAMAEVTVLSSAGIRPAFNDFMPGAWRPPDRSL